MQLEHKAIDGISPHATDIATIATGFGQRGSGHNKQRGPGVRDGAAESHKLG
jgi:hypothetical protein